MKRAIFTIICLLPFFISHADSTSLFQNFEVSCASASGFPGGWMMYNPIAATIPSGQWTCAPGEGRYGTAGITCTGDYGGGYNLDTSYLITPQLYLGSYTGNVYLQFDTRTSFISGERLMVQESTDSGASFPAASYTFSVNPVIGPGDSSGWVTHQVNLTPFKSESFFVAFLYTSPNTYGTHWYIDNVLTTTVPLGITDPQRQNIPLSVIGKATSSQIKISYGMAVTGTYDLAIYNMMGSVVSRQMLNVYAGTTYYTIDNLDLVPGMYLIRMGNGTSYGVVKAMVE